MSRIPEARLRLADVWADIEEMQTYARAKFEKLLAELTTIQVMMTRESPSRRAPVSKRLTRAKASSIRRYAKNHPKASMQTIAQVVGVNMGRVSEILSGKRFPEK